MKRRCSGLVPLGSQKIDRALGKVIGKAAERGDPHGLKAQLDLSAQSVRATRLIQPLWALGLILLCATPLGIFGHRPVGEALYLPLIVLVACLSTAAGAAAQQHRTADDPNCDLASWARFGGIMQVLVSAGRGTMPWILWDLTNAVNHIFLAACAIAVVSALAVARQ